MKKFTAIMIFCIICTAITLSACDGKVDEIQTFCLTDSDTFYIPIENPSAGLGGFSDVWFNIDGDIADIAAAINNHDYGNAEVQATVFQGRYVFIQKTGKTDNKKHFYVVLRSKYDITYILRSSAFSVQNETVYAPVHLMLWDKNEGYFDLNHGNKVELYSSVQDFVGFYNETDIYDVKYSDNIMSVKIVDNAVPENSFHTKKDFDVKFTTDGDRVFAEYDFK